MTKTKDPLKPAVKISVVIPNWNGRHFLKVCLDSLRMQTGVGFEIIMVDGGSEDGSEEFVREKYPEVRVEQLETNRGFAFAVNKGIKSARGQYVFLLNNDTELARNCLRILAGVLEAEESVWFCAPKMLYYQRRDLINNAGDILSSYGIAHQRGKGEKDRGQYDWPEYIFGACAGAAMYKKELFTRLGFFDENFHSYLEDIDFDFRAQLAGRKCLYVPAAVVYHVDGGTSKKIRNFSRLFIARNALYIIAKDFPWPVLILFSPFLLLGQLRNVFIGLKHGCPGLIFRVYFDFFRHLPRLLRQRRKIQKSRSVSYKYLLTILSKRYPFSVKKSLGEMIK